MKKTKRIAVGAILSALGVVILLLGSIISVLDLTSVALASLLIIIAVIEVGGAYPYLIWLVTAALALIIVPDKFGALLYLLFGGVYPIFKAMFERLHYAVSWVLKLSFFNLSLTLFILLCNYIFKLPDTSMGYTIPVYALCNLTFILYDIAVTKLITFYLIKFRKIISKTFFS